MLGEDMADSLTLPHPLPQVGQLTSLCLNQRVVLPGNRGKHQATHDYYSNALRAWSFNSCDSFPDKLLCFGAQVVVLPFNLSYTTHPGHVAHLSSSGLPFPSTLELFSCASSDATRSTSSCSSLLALDPCVSDIQPSSSSTPLGAGDCSNAQFTWKVRQKQTNASFSK